MAKRILVIGGTRLFGIRLVHRLLEAGHQVTIATRGLAADPFADRVVRIRVDRRDRAAMVAAFARVDGYDVVYDQMCYRAADAAIALEVLGPRAARHVMTSTIEVYDRCYGVLDRPFVEADAVLDDAAPGADEPGYAQGKRQAEAVLAGAALPTVRIRIGHVLAGPEDFTGRLASYVERVRTGAPLRHSVCAAAASFVGVDGVTDFLAWLGDAAITGPVNAASHAWSAVDLHQRVAATLGVPAALVPVAAAPPTELSPFDFAARYEMSTARAAAAGYRFATDDGWLDDAIQRHATRLAG